MGEAAFLQSSAHTQPEQEVVEASAPLKFLESATGSDSKIVSFPNLKKIDASGKHTFLDRASRAFTPVIVLLILIQVFDGLLTGFGVSQFGLVAEGNPVVRALMHTVGPTPALLIAKLLSCGIIVILAFQALSISWLRVVLRAVAAVYLCFAILPWTFLIFSSVL